MALRTFIDRDGLAWNAWHVQPAGAGVGYAERYRDGWVCFERVGGGGRCRIPLDQMPPDWDSLPDDRLELIRRVAEASSANTGTARIPDNVRQVAEDMTQARKTGPAEVIGPEVRDP